MPTQLCVHAGAHSIVRNVLNYFCEDMACIHQLLQNVRRAETFELRVEIDTRVGQSPTLS